MGQVNVSINDRSYSVACGDGEEDHLRELARYLDGHVGDLAKSVGQVGDTRLLLLAGLLRQERYCSGPYFSLGNCPWGGPWPASHGAHLLL